MSARRTKAKRFLHIVEASNFLDEALRSAQEACLPNWWIVGGAIRDTIWGTIADSDKNFGELVRDVDLVYYDQKEISKKKDEDIEANLKPIFGVPWSVKNQARMHVATNDAPYSSVEEAMYCFPETISGIGIRTTANEKYICFTCFGFDDLFSMTFRPTPHFLSRADFDAFVLRVQTKSWLNKWPSARSVPW